MNFKSIYSQIRLIMKISVFLLFAAIFQLYARSSYSQETKMNITASSVRLKQLFNDIEKQSEFLFFYVDADIEGVEVSVNAHHASIMTVLNQALSRTPLMYEIDDRYVTIAPRTLTKAQGIAVTGTVTDAAGDPMPGVNVVIKGTTIGVVTNFSGNYNISVPDKNAVLVFSFVGYGTDEYQVSDRTKIDVTMIEDARELEEVVVIGYGVVKKSDLTGSVASVKTVELQQTPITSIDQGLVGRASGVQVTQTSGMPGAVASIRIRGSSSLQGGNEPLYVIDGFPVYNGEGFGNTGGNARLSGLSTINPSDIESIEILKDASTTAIYGSRAANGVVLITTKSGRNGYNNITFDSYVGLQKVANTIDLMDARQYADLIKEAYGNDGLNLPPGFDDATLEAVGEGTDWQNEIFRTAPVQNYQLTAAGGDDKTRYSLSGGYFNQQGVIINSKFERFAGRINFDRYVFKNFKIGTHISAARMDNQAAQTDAGDRNGVVNQALKFSPVLPVYFDPELGIYTEVNTPGVQIPNPVATAKEMKRQTKNTRLLGDIYGEWEIIPDLTAKVMVGVDLSYNKNDSYTPSYLYQAGGIASGSVSSGQTTNWINENTLTWSKKINENNSFSLLAGATFQHNLYEGSTATSSNFVNDVLEENSLGSASTYGQPASSETEWGLISYLGRINYNFRHRYLFSLTGRTDGSSRFGANNKWAFFPSGAFAWRISEEGFMSGIDKLTNLKLRISYGITGNQEIGLYGSLPTLASNKWTIGKQLVTGFYPNKIPDPNLKWERTGQFDTGLDIGLFSNRLRITADIYYKKTTDLLYSVAIPYTSGFGNMLQNIGSLENKGVELSIDSDNLTGAFRWTTGFNISFNRNKVLSLGGEQYKDVGDGDSHLKISNIHRLIINEPIGIFYGYMFDGIFQTPDEVSKGPKGPTNGVGLRRYKDLSGINGEPDGSADATYDRTIIGDPNPKFFGGMTNTFNYKGFECNIFLQYCYGNDLFNYNAIELTLPSGEQNVYADLVNRWTGPGTSNKYPKATTNRSAVVSDAFVEDGSYLKLKTLTFAYTFPWLRTKHIDGLRVYITAQNLFTWTNYGGYDPEVSYRGASTLGIGEDYGGYPQAKTLMFGIKLEIK